MEQEALMDALVQAKRMGNCLHEVLDLTRQLAEAADRNDDVSIRLVMAMRQEPIDGAAQADDALRTQLDALREEAAHAAFAALLGGQGGKEPMEKALAERMAANRRTLEEIRAIDSALRQRLSRGRVKTE